MGRSAQRRAFLCAVGGAGLGVSSGCLSNNQISEGESWPEATRNTLSEPELQLIRNAGLPPEDIDSETDAIRAAMIVGWSHQLDELNQDQLGIVESFLQTAGETERTLRDVEQNLEDVDELITTMKSEEISGVSAWDVVTTVSSSAEAFDEAVSTLLRETRDWRNLLTSTTETLGESLQLIRAQLQSQTLQSGEVETMSQNIDATLKNLGELESRASDLREDLSSAAEITSTVAANSDTFQERGFADLTDEIETTYGTASDLFAKAASEIEIFNEELRSARSVLSELESGAADIQQETLNEIRGRFSPG